VRSIAFHPTSASLHAGLFDGNIELRELDMRRLQYTDAGGQFVTTDPGNPLSMVIKEVCLYSDLTALQYSPGLQSFDPNLLTHLNKLTTINLAGQDKVNFNGDEFMHVADSLKSLNLVQTGLTDLNRLSNSKLCNLHSLFAMSNNFSSNGWISTDLLNTFGHLELFTVDQSNVRNLEVATIALIQQRGYLALSTAKSMLQTLDKTTLRCEIDIVKSEMYKQLVGQVLPGSATFSQSCSNKYVGLSEKADAWRASPGDNVCHLSSVAVSIALSNVIVFAMIVMASMKVIY